MPVGSCRGSLVLYLGRPDFMGSHGQRNIVLPGRKHTYAQQTRSLTGSRIAFAPESIVFLVLGILFPLLLFIASDG